jgi:hypothetical protein
MALRSAFISHDPGTANGAEPYAIPWCAEP